MKYPLQKELEKDTSIALDLYNKALASGDAKQIEIALAFLNAMNRINTICVNRNRY